MSIRILRVLAVSFALTGCGADAPELDEVGELSAASYTVPIEELPGNVGGSCHIVGTVWPNVSVCMNGVVKKSGSTYCCDLTDSPSCPTHYQLGTCSTGGGGGEYSPR